MQRGVRRGADLVGQQSVDLRVVVVELGEFGRDVAGRLQRAGAEGVLDWNIRGTTPGEIGEERREEPEGARVLHAENPRLVGIAECGGGMTPAQPPHRHRRDHRPAAKSGRSGFGKPNQRPAASATNRAATITIAATTASVAQPFSAAQLHPISKRLAAITRLTTAVWLSPLRTACW